MTSCIPFFEKKRIPSPSLSPAGTAADAIFQAHLSLAARPSRGSSTGLSFFAFNPPPQQQRENHKLSAYTRKGDSSPRYFAKDASCHDENFVFDADDGIRRSWEAIVILLMPRLFFLLSSLTLSRERRDFWRCWWEVLSSFKGTLNCRFDPELLYV